MATLQMITEATKGFADRRDLLAARVQELHDKVEALKREHLPGIREAAGDAANALEWVRALVEESPEAFVRPRSVIISGIKVGFKKGSGKAIIEDEERTILLIRKHIPQAEQASYIEVVEKLKKKNFGELDVATLKKIGVQIEGTGDVVVVKPVDTDVDKLVKAMLKDAGEEIAEQEAA